MKMKIKTSFRFYLTLVKRAISKNTNNKCWQGCGEKRPSYSVGGNVNCYNLYGNSMEAPQKTINRTASNITPRHVFEGMLSEYSKNTCAPMFITHYSQ
jgi:hypothetical protein